MGACRREHMSLQPYFLHCQFLLEPYPDQSRRRIRIRQCDDPLRLLGSLDDVDQLAREQHGLSRTGPCIDIHDVRLAEHGIPLLFVQPGEIGSLDLLLIVHIFVMSLMKRAPFRS